MFAGASISVLVASLLLSAVETMAVTVVMIVAYLTGIAAAGESILGPDGPSTSFVLLVEGLVAAVAVRALRRTAVRADEALDHEVADERAVIVEADRQRESEAQEWLLHDKVRSTLWLVGDGHLLGRRTSALGSCEESLAALRDLREGRIADDLARSARHTVQKAIDWACSAGLDVSLTGRSFDMGASATADATNMIDAEGDIPAAVCEAIGAATRQALANVRAHAGTGSAHVEVVSGPTAVQVTVRDRGRGFDPTRTSADKQGIRASIVGRMQEVAGSADIESKPGLGTTVTLTWRASPLQAPAAPDGGGGALRLYGVSLLPILAAAGLVYHGLSLYAVLHFASDYAFAWVALAAWAAILGVGIALTAGTSRSRTGPVSGWLGVGVAVAAATVVVLDCHPRGVLGFANWSFADTVWPLAFATAYLPPRRVVLALVAHDAIQTAVIAAKLGKDLPGLLKLSAVLLENAMLQAGLAIAFAILMHTTDVTARAAWKSGLHRARLYAEQLARRSRANRAAKIDAEIYSLLESVSSGALDPDDRDTRRRFQSASATMRRQNVLAEFKADVTELEIIAERSTAADVHVEIGLAENLDGFPAPVREAMVAVMAGALRLARPGKVLIVLHNHADMTLRDWEVAGPDRHRNVHSMTFFFTVLKADAAVLRQEIRRHQIKGTALAFDLDLDDEAASETAQVWLAMAGR